MWEKEVVGLGEKVVMKLIYFEGSIIFILFFEFW